MLKFYHFRYFVCTINFKLKGIILSTVRYGEFTYPLDKLILMKSKGIKTTVPHDKLVINCDTVINKEGCVLVTPNADNFVVLSKPDGITLEGKVTVTIFSKVLLKSVRTVMTPIINEPRFENNPRFIDNRDRGNGYDRQYQSSSNGYRDRY